MDAFFPIIRYVDGAVDDIDSLTIDPTTDPKKTTAYLGLGLGSVTAGINGDGNERFKQDEKGSDKKRNGLWRTPDHLSTPRISLCKRLRASFPHFYPPPQLLRPFTYLRLFLLPTSSAVKRKHEQAPKMVFDRSTMLKNMTDMRKLVTGLTRLLIAKGAVIGRLRKRAKEEGGTVEAYIGDVEGDYRLCAHSSCTNVIFKTIFCCCKTVCIITSTSFRTANRPTCLISMYHLRLRRGEQIRRSWRCQSSRSLSCPCSLSSVGNCFVVPHPFPSVILIFDHCVSIFCLSFFPLSLPLLSFPFLDY